MAGPRARRRWGRAPTWPDKRGPRPGACGGGVASAGGRPLASSAANSPEPGAPGRQGILCSWRQERVPLGQAGPGHDFDRSPHSPV